ncbi:hypothetical protein Afil01_49380 [Actinorhabdospora filicis]|uniref:DUF3000 domain-containing protein n=1 Tax=Actinorhabdospora filicis TaxID=1785913 RepID=A0A9W6SQ17_9ACTN|nr:DUF3000 domain-containing protein [Actinorhabdospora filicis]GLZ80131.1 hypothetical protein Afil01_49380 [Actinorhabdospora filicis]
MTPSTASPPESFARAVTGLRALRPRAEITLQEMPAPTKLAPFAFALTATVAGRGDPEAATGRLILLHEPAGHDAWDGTLRLVTYVCADLDPEVAADPLLPTVAWSWLTDALDAAGADYRAAGGTVTQTSSTSFGDLAEREAVAEVEMRASWTPGGEDLTAHLSAWCELLATMAGLPPPGVALIG